MGNRQSILPGKVQAVDLLVTENGISHHTDVYDEMRQPQPNLVIRRGQTFLLQIKLNRSFNPDTDALSFVFTVSGMSD